jgi:predicted alpha/beta-hydrolase family hydrolase
LTEAVAFLFAPGAGAPSTSAWMQAFRARLAQVGRTECLDYPYQKAGRRTPDRHPLLVAAHRLAFEELRASHAGPIVLVGKSMGGRIGCHLAVELGGKGPSAVVCLGYPLVGQRGAVRDAVLLELRTPVLFVQGTRDAMCPLLRLAEIRGRMQAPTELYTVEDGDHSLIVTKGRLKAHSTSQEQIDAQVVAALAAFAKRHAPTMPHPP